MNAVRTLFFLLLLLVLTLTVLIAGATGVGALLNRLLPGIGLGTGTLIGVVALSVCLHFALVILGQVHVVREELDDAEMEEFVAAIRRPARNRRSRR
jgi:hypothetical protein